ncbi:MAG: class I SAM-dependent methyltransferase [Streptosporangiales bacterium]
MSESTAAYWDGQAATFDDEADHGLRDPAVRRAWAELLGSVLPESPATVLDLGCGTGTLSVLLAEGGYAVSGVDLSSRMVSAAGAKAAAAGVTASFKQADASRPPYEPGSFDVLLARHVLWALPDADAALASWTRLLRPQGVLVLVEGYWSTGAGIRAAECEGIVRRHRQETSLLPLDDQLFWGRPIDDERYLVVSPC